MADEPVQKRDHRLYRGQTKSFTDVNGNNYPESFWIWGLVVDPWLKILEIRCYGFPSTEIFDFATAHPFTEEDRGFKNPVFRGTAFDSLIAANQPLVQQTGISVKQIQSLIKDCPSADGQSMISFFADATDVPFPGE